MKDSEKPSMNACERPPPVADSKLRLNTKAAAVVAGAVALSRVLGLVREVLFAALFGAGRNMDAFFMAFKAPNLLRDLFAEGALSTAFITVFSKKMQTEGDASAWALASKMATMTLVFMSAITLLGMVFADQIIAFLAPGFDPEKAALTSLLTRIMYPFILLVSLAALVMGMLNAKNIFGIPALASSFFNIGSILGGVGIGYWLDPSFGPRALIGLACGTLIGGLFQLGIQLPSLRRAGFRFHFDFQWRDEGVRRVLAILLPSVIAGSAVQINVMVNAIFASYLADGAVSWLQYAFRLMQLPLGIFGVAIATVTLPVVSKIAAGGDLLHFRETISKAMRLAVFLTIPSAIGLAVLAEPVISLIYERGRFTAFESLMTAQALQFYAIGLVGYSCVKVLAPAFYAIDRRWTPMTVSFVSIGINVVLNYLLIFQFGWGHRGLAFSTAVAATFNFVTLFFIMRKHLTGLETGLFTLTIFRCLLAGGILVGAVWATWIYLEPIFVAGGLLVRIVTLLGTIGVGATMYLLVCQVLQVQEVTDACKLLGDRLARRGRKGVNS